MNCPVFLCPPLYTLRTRGFLVDLSAHFTIVKRDDLSSVLTRCYKKPLSPTTLQKQCRIIFVWDLVICCITQYETKVLCWRCYFLRLTKTSRDIKNGADKRKAIRMQHWGAEIMDYSTTLSQAQITVVIGLLSVPVLEKSLSKTTWVENPVNLVSLLSIKLLWVALSSDFMNQGQKIQLLVSFEVAKFTNAFWRHECCKILFRFYSLCQPASIDKAFKNGALPVGNNFFHYNI